MESVGNREVENMHVLAEAIVVVRIDYAEAMQAALSWWVEVSDNDGPRWVRSHGLVSEVEIEPFHLLVIVPHDPRTETSTAFA